MLGGLYLFQSLRKGDYRPDSPCCGETGANENKLAPDLFCEVIASSAVLDVIVWELVKLHSCVNSRQLESAWNFFFFFFSISTEAS